MDSPRPPHGPTARGSRTVSRILDAAARLFGKEGYEGATMNAVARAAGVSKGLLHYHFRSKEHLLIEAQRATFHRVQRQFEERSRQGDRGMSAALFALDTLWGAVREMHAWTPFMVETMSLAGKTGPVREHLDRFYAESDEMLVRGIERVFAGELDRLALPPERLAWLVRTTLHGLIVELAYARTPNELARIDQSYADFRRFFEETVLRR